jgi:hypothetical protein
VDKAHLTVAADAKSKTYGDANPAFTDTISGFVNGDTSGVVSGTAALGTTATAASPVGTYTITVAQGTLTATNYDFTTFTPGTLTIVPQTTLTQTVSGTASSLSVLAGHGFSVGVQYTTSDNDNTLTGLGLRIHYNSSLLTFSGLSNVLQAGFIQQSGPIADTADYDHDPATDKYVLVSWADINGKWPNQGLPVSLLTSGFTLAPGVAAGTQTTIRFTASSTAAGYNFQSQSITVTAQTVNLDIDGSGGPPDAQHDGVLILRYLFGFRDTALVDGVLSPNATRTDPTAIATFLDGGRSTMLDVDGNGTVDALTDGILIDRYLSGWTGQQLVAGALAPNATRTDPAAIVTYLGSFMPLEGLQASDDPSPALAATPSMSLNAEQATPTITSSNLVSTTYDPAGATQLDPPQGLQASDNPSPASTATKSASINVEQAAPTISSFQAGTTYDTAVVTQPASVQGLQASDATAPASVAAQVVNRQIVTPDPLTQTVSPGSPVVLHVNYTTDPANADVTGLGLRIHYNSSLLTFGGIADRLGTGFIQEQTPVDDTENYDGDPLTDKYVLISWADLNSNWPGELDIRLFTANYTAAQTASGSTSVNFTASSTASGWTLDAKSAVINFQTVVSGSISGWAYVDANRNGKIDAGECLPGVTISLDGPAKKTTTTDDNGWYQFSGLPAGTYQVSETHPKACLPGGPDSIAANVVNGQDSRVDFWDGGLRPGCIPNRVLATSSLPVGSAQWNQVMRQAVASAEQTGYQSVQPIAVAAQQATTIPQPALNAQAETAAPDVIASNLGSVSPPTVVPNAPQASGTPARTAQAATITQDTIGPIVTEAIARWAVAGLDQQTLATLRNTSFVVSNLPGSYLGMTDHNTVYLDQDAAGYGWFVDPTPAQDEEFQPAKATGQLQAVDPRALAHMDLLTVVEHELGHVAGLPDANTDTSGLMSPHLGTGLRRVPGPLEIDAVFALGIWGDQV